MSVICIVDDDPDVRELVEYKLVQNGHEVLSATNGQDALLLVPDAKPALLLLDVMMPGLSGFDVLSQLRANPATRALPIIMLTAKAQDADAERGFALGANDYMLKPFSPRELLNRINAQLMLVG
ncbi:MAG: two-component system, OmpR family, alkaline phosphatase synthesis response regulator PhoP [Actinomycetota bacterium]|jgi:DNA-binding response OmpR family regulator|nr:two-component system, OmpR family, alkaline phosphatase synthesis response regulator PhoP [Actinomycetota bacterium]